MHILHIEVKEVKKVEINKFCHNYQYLFILNTKILLNKMQLVSSMIKNLIKHMTQFLTVSSAIDHFCVDVLFCALSFALFGMLFNAYNEIHVIRNICYSYHKRFNDIENGMYSIVEKMDLKDLREAREKKRLKKRNQKRKQRFAEKQAKKQMENENTDSKLTKEEQITDAIKVLQNLLNEDLIEKYQNNDLFVHPCDEKLDDDSQ